MYMQRDELAPGALMNPIVEDNSGGHGASASSTAALPLDDMLSLTISFPLPLGLGGKQIDAEGELLAMQTMQLAEHESMARMISAMIQGKLAELRSLREQYELMTTVTLPTLELSLQTAVVNYQNFKTDIVSILSAELDLLHRAEESFQLAADYHKALAELEYLTGAELWRM
jgi:outer membrane protein, heavy metal efflux system